MQVLLETIQAIFKENKILNEKLYCRNYLVTSTLHEYHPNNLAPLQNFSIKW